MKRRRGGFTFVELLVSMTIVGILASVAIPKYRAVKRQALATQIVGDVDVVRVATMNFFADSGYYPREIGAGHVPNGMTRYLPLNFKFMKPDWTLDYDNVQLRQGGQLVGLSFITADASLGTTAIKPFATGGSSYAFWAAGRYTIVYFGP